jgi:hypothetical protein
MGAGASLHSILFPLFLLQHPLLVLLLLLPLLLLLSLTEKKKCAFT